VRGHPAIDNVRLFDRPSGFSAFLRFVREVRAERYDLVLDLQRHVKSGFVSMRSGAPRRIGFHRKNSREFNWLFNTECIREWEHYSPKVAQYQSFGDALGLPTMEPLDFGLEPSLDEKESFRRKLKEEWGDAHDSKLPPKEQRVALILGSTWQSRFWLAERYVELVRRMSAEGYTFLLVGGPSEEQFAKEIISQCTAGTAVNLVKKTSLRELVPLFSEVSMALGSDSGPMHIAAAVGIPVISLWGSTSPKRSAPYGSESLILQSAVACSPCYRKDCPGLDTLCMKSISVDAVMAQMSRTSSRQQ
jgi:lipopolysaccharide heptosyltransferase II